MKKTWTDFYAWFTAFFHKAKKGATQIGATTKGFYGRVNWWCKDRKLLVKELNAIADAGLAGYMIEMAGYNGWKFADGSTSWNEEWLKKTCEEYKWLLKQCRRRKLLLFNSIVNDNLGRKGGKKIIDYWPLACALMDCVKQCGSANVYVQPTAETQTVGGRNFDHRAISVLAGFQLVYNGGSRPSAPIPGYQWFAVHPASIATKNANGSWVVSDHSLIIKELNGGPIDGHGNPDRIQDWVARNNNPQHPVIGYYAYEVQDFDKDTIKTLGKAL